MPQTDSALELSFRMGQALLENGAEISRVQETMERVVQSYQVESFNVYVLTNAIFVTGTEAGVEHAAKLKHVPSTSTHLGRICAVNQLSREIAQGEHTVAEAFAQLDSIEVLPYSPLPLAVLGCAVGSAAFSYLFGGSPFDAFVAFFCGLALECYLYFAGKRGMSKFLTNLSASALVTLCGGVLFLCGLGHNMDKIIIGSIIRLVPGVALTTSIRDFFHGDYLSGAIRMLDAFLVGGCIAVGVGFVVKVLSTLTGGALL
ncbi:threonine/serine exporter family protein [Oscillospiraceae bacterium 42-9]